MNGKTRNRVQFECPQELEDRIKAEPGTPSDTIRELLIEGLDRRDRARKELITIPRLWLEDITPGCAQCVREWGPDCICAGAGSQGPLCGNCH